MTPNGPARAAISCAVVAWGALLVAATLPPDGLRPAALDPITHAARAALRRVGVRANLRLFQGDGVVEAWPDGVCPLIFGLGDSVTLLAGCPATRLVGDGWDEALTVATEVMHRAHARGRPEEADRLAALVADYHCQGSGADRIAVYGLWSFQRLADGVQEPRIEPYLHWDCRRSERLPLPWPDGAALLEQSR